MKLFKRATVFVVLAAILLVLPNAAIAAEDPYAQLKEALLQTWQNREPSLDLRPYQISGDEFDTAYKEVRKANRGFWYVQRSSISFSGDYITKVEFDYMPAEEVQVMQYAIDDALSGILPGMTDAQKALVLHDYLVLNCAYDMTYSVYTAYGALVQGTAVCQGYAEAYEILLSVAGIDSVLVSSGEMNHAWNLVEIDGKWYHVDTTWDDPVWKNGDGYADRPGYVGHEHFLRSDAGIQEEDHYGWTTDIVCDSTLYDHGMYWENVESAVLFESANEILLRRDGSGTVEIVKHNLTDGTETTVYKNENSRFTFEGGTWFTYTSGISRDDGKLYFGDLSNMYVLSDLSGEPETVCTIADFPGANYFAGSFVKDGILYASVNTMTRNEDGSTRTTSEMRTLQLDQAHIHTWDEGVITTPATEFEEGIKTYTCTSCGRIRLEYLPVVDHTHTYTAYVTQATCTGEGFTHYVCGCGDSYTADFVDPLGHDYGAWQDNVPASCTGSGFQWRECTRCGVTDHREVPATGHSFGEWFTTTEPTEFANGWQARDCASCGHREVQEISNNPFADINDDDRFLPPVLWAYYNNLISGKDATHFDPEGFVTRGQFVMFLWRAAGEPEPTITESPFSDVQGNDRFKKAVLWALENKITAGMSDGTFGLNKPCTRGQVVMFLYRFAGKPDFEITHEDFPDVSPNDSYYKAVMWAREMGITGGQSDGNFGLNGTCKRVHAVAFLYRYVSQTM